MNAEDVLYDKLKQAAKDRGQEFTEQDLIDLRGDVAHEIVLASMNEYAKLKVTERQEQLKKMVRDRWVEIQSMKQSEILKLIEP